MKLRAPLIVGLLFGVALLPRAGKLHAQPLPATIRVLELDGTNSYVRLPDNTFTNLTEGTVEAWVKWANAADYQRFFNFGDFLDDMAWGLHWALEAKR
jgi:hypothetical protein